MISLVENMSGLIQCIAMVAFMQSGNHQGRFSQSKSIVVLEKKSCVGEALRQLFEIFFKCTNSKK